MLNRRDKAALLKVCQVDEEDLADRSPKYAPPIRKPASNFREEAVQSVTPDILMQPLGRQLVLELNQETLPRDLVNTEYYATISKG